MAKEPWGYLSSWFVDHRNTTRLLSGPLFVIIGPIGIGVSIAESDMKMLLVSIAILCGGLFIMLFGVADYLGRPLPTWVSAAIAVGGISAYVVIHTR